MDKRLMLPVCLLAVSCTVGPDYERPQFFDDAQLSAALPTAKGDGRPVSVRWYEQFNDETLNNLVQQAVSGSPNVRIALHRLRQARYVLQIDETKFLPEFTAAGGYQYNYLAEEGRFSQAKEDFYKAGLDASWEIDIWGGGRRLREEASALAKAAADNLADVRLAMAAEAAADYLALRTVQEQLRITAENLRLQKDIRQTVQDKYDSGLADSAALAQAAYAVETTAAQIPELEQREENYKNALAVLLGKLPGNIDGLEKNAPNLIRRPLAFRVENLYDFPLSVVRCRPDVRMAENNLIAKNAAVGQAVAKLFPSVSLSALLGWQAGNLSSFGASSAAAYGFAPTISVPLFNFDRLRNQVALSREVKEEYIVVYQNTLLTAAEEIKNAVIAVRKEYERSRRLARSADNMQKVLSVMRDKYRNGLTEFGDLLSAEQNLLNAQNALAASVGSVYGNIVSFYKAVGGGR